MQIGDTHEEVDVNGGGLAQVNTESNELGGTITGKEILQLQLNGRNFTQLITLVPGVSNQTGQDEGEVGPAANVNYSVNGGRTEYNNWEVDGGVAGRPKSSRLASSIAWPVSPVRRSDSRRNPGSVTHDIERYS
jgi:hypothetical protein